MDQIFPKSKTQINREKYAAQAVAELLSKKEQQTRRKEYRETKPAWGSQQWAETRGDDLGLSGDY